MSTTKSTTKAKGGKVSAPEPASATTPAPLDELHHFAHHFAAALHLARYSAAISVTLYNGMVETWQDFQNDMPSLGAFSETAAYITLALETDAEQRTARKGRTK